MVFSIVEQVSMRTYEVSSVRKALEILCAFSPQTLQLSVSEISRRLGIPKSTTHNLLRTLQSYQFLIQHPEEKRYRLGPKLFELGLLFSQTMRLVTVALPHLRRLADQTKETVKLGLLSGDEALIVAAVESPFQLHTRGDEGRRTPLHSTGLGKAILAALPNPEVREIVARRGLAPFTPRTITSLRRLEQEIEQIRERGYALDWEENEEGVRCAAATVNDPAVRVPAAISVSGPALRVTEERIGQYATFTVETAEHISRALRKQQ